MNLLQSEQLELSSHGLQDLGQRLKALADRQRVES